MRVPRLAASALVAGMALAAEAAPSAAVRNEVLHLLGYVESSQCAFYRNGKWHDARAARRHLQRKYDYLAKRDLVRRTEDFLELAATRSSVSGEAYRVRCQDNQPMASSAWLGKELTRYRSEP
jgi:hypothetical protein